MDKIALPSQEELNENFNYDRLTGILTRVSNGHTAGTKKPNGYIQMGFKGTLYLAHRIIWRMETGEDPGELMIDHKNRIRNDNRIENLRLANQSLQEINKKSKGYSYNKRDKCYSVYLNYQGIARVRKSTKTEAEAIRLVESIREEWFRESKSA